MSCQDASNLVAGDVPNSPGTASTDKHGGNLIGLTTETLFWLGQSFSRIPSNRQPLNPRIMWSGKFAFTGRRYYCFVYTSFQNEMEFTQLTTDLMKRIKTTSLRLNRLVSTFGQHSFHIPDSYLSTLLSSCFDRHIFASSRASHSLKHFIHTSNIYPGELKFYFLFLFFIPPIKIQSTRSAPFIFNNIRQDGFTLHEDSPRPCPLFHCPSICRLWHWYHYSILGLLQAFLLMDEEDHSCIWCIARAVLRQGRCSLERFRCEVFMW